MSSID